MTLADIPVFREARRGQVVRSDDWNGIQREMRNSLRTHRHTRLAGGPSDDAAPQDVALQITTAEIADGAVTPEKLSSAVRESLAAPGGGGVESHSGVVNVAAGGRQRIQHGFGNVPVSIALGIRQTVQQLNAVFEVYGGPVDRPRAFAAVPTDPDGTFVLVSTSDVAHEVRWWAYAQLTA